LSNDYHFLLQNLRAAFYKFDDDHNGLINKEDGEHKEDHLGTELWIKLFQF